MSAANQLELFLVFIAVIVGVVSAGYFYQSVGIFMSALQKPLRLISSGMMVIAFGVLLAAFTSFQPQASLSGFFYGIPLEAVFYIFYVFYIAGSLMILAGARRFSRKPHSVVDVSLQKAS